MIEVTKEMEQAGKDITNNLTFAQAAKKCNGLGGSKTWAEWLEQNMKDCENSDLIFSYLNGVMDAVTVVYIAMERAKVC